MPSRPDEDADSDSEFLNAADAAEEVDLKDDDHPMGDASDEEDASDDDGQQTEEVTLQNDSRAYFDAHRDSVFAIAQHPVHTFLVATGGSEGPEDDAPGMGYVVDTSPTPEKPVLPASYNADPGAGAAQTVGLKSVVRIDGHKDSVTALEWTLPRGDVLLSGGMDGKVRATIVGVKDGEVRAKTLGEVELQDAEVIWLSACPAPEYENAFAVGGSDGSVWVYMIEPKSKKEPLVNTKSYFLHLDSCTAGTWTPDGKLLLTVSQDGSFYAWDVWGIAAGKGLLQDTDAALISLTAEDKRFAAGGEDEEGGLFSVAVEPNGQFVAVGGSRGAIRVVSLPRLDEGVKGGQILASLQTQSDNIESLSFTSTSASASTASSTTTLLASGCVDGSIAIFDTTRRFAVRRHISNAHDSLSVVKVSFVPGSWLLTSCGMDGVVRRWDIRGGANTGPAGAAVVVSGGAGAGARVDKEHGGMVSEWKGHRGGGEGGGVLGFVQGGRDGGRVVTAGDDGLVLVFDT